MHASAIYPAAVGESSGGRKLMRGLRAGDRIMKISRFLSNFLQIFIHSEIEGKVHKSLEIHSGVPETARKCTFQASRLLEILECRG